MSPRLSVSSMSRVLAVCGMPGSGKGEFAQIFMDAGIPVRSMGDMVREEVARRALEVVQKCSVKSLLIYAENSVKMSSQYA